MSYVKTFLLKTTHNISVNYYQDVIKELMDLKGLSQQQLANILGIDQTTVSKWLLGKMKPGYDNILALYEKFGVEPNVLFGIEK